MEVISTSRLEAIASRLEAIAIRLRLEAIAIRLEAVGIRLQILSVGFCSLTDFGFCGFKALPLKNSFQELEQLSEGAPTQYIVAQGVCFLKPGEDRMRFVSTCGFPSKD